MAERRGLRTSLYFGLPLLAILLLVAFWSWDWFIPFVSAWASAEIGRPVTIAHLHVRPGKRTRIVADGVMIGNPAGFPADAPPLAAIAHLGVTVDVMQYIRHRIISVPLIDLSGPDLQLRAMPDGTNNYTLALKASPRKPGQAPAPGPKLGTVTIEGGRLQADIPKLHARLNAKFSTAKAEGIIARNGQATEITAHADGVYARQRISGTLLTGAILSVTDKTKPFPIDLKLANGDTHVALAGTVQDPLAFAGTDLDLTLSGVDMADLYPLAGIPIPKTPAYKITGKLNYERSTGRIRFDDMHGVVGNTDLEGTIAEAPQGKKPDVTMNLASQRVDLADLGGFIGTNPGRATTKNATPEQREKAATGARRAHRLLPSTRISLPKLNAANIHLHYVGHHIEGRNIPLDSLIVTMDVKNGVVDLHPLIFTIGTGRVQGNVSITPVSDKRVKLKADVHFDNVDVSRLMEATHTFRGAGAISGRATIDGTGDSVATVLGDGNGGLDLYMSGGDLSALLVDLSGLEFGKALLSALHIPARTPVECMITDFALHDGLVTSRALLVDTGEAMIGGTGDVNLKTEAMNFDIETQSKNFSIGNLPAPIKIGGTLEKPSIGVGIKSLAARGGIAAALGFLAAPLAILPTIEFGVKDPHKCGQLVTEIKSQVRKGRPGQPVQGVPKVKLP